MPLTPEQRDTFFALFSGLSAGHVSTIVASLSEPGSRIGTSTNSPNYRFLTQLCEWGFAKEQPSKVELPPELQAVLVTFQINEEAKAEIAELVRRAAEDPLG